jgi:hypothetical protein
MRTFMACLAIVLGNGCVVVHDNPQPPPPQGPPLYRIQIGASTIVQPGSQAGYGITANVGGAYRCVWTGQSSVTYNNFRGSIFTPGHFTAFTPGCNGFCPDHPSDVFGAPAPVTGGGEQVTFDTLAASGLDGLDFGVDTEPVTFTLYIDGAAYPSLVFFPNTDTQQIAAPQSIPFSLTTN